IHISNKHNDIVLEGKRDPDSQLFVLCEAPDTTNKQAVMLTKDNSKPANQTDLLWQMHLRHGHRNFYDVARQYGLSLPKTMPTCSSCIMGKSHAHTPWGSGFERATRRAEGFHSDFRGPLSVPTPQGYLYFLSIIDDYYSRRIFGFL